MPEYFRTGEIEEESDTNETQNGGKLSSKQIPGNYKHRFGG